MRILICHNFYALRGGEDEVVEREIDLLRANGHEVTLFSYSNSEAAELSQVALGTRALYSLQTGRDVREVLARQAFDVAHVHNTWMLMSPAVYRDLWEHGLPVVKTVHNFRWLCPVGTFYRDGHVCQDCVQRPGGVLNGVWHRCFRDSVQGSAVASARLWLSRDVLGLTKRFIDIVIVQNGFVRDHLLAQGFSAEHMRLKGNFIPAESVHAPRKGEHAIFFGRLEETKGIRTLLRAAKQTKIPLRLYGKGPMEGWIRQTLEQHSDELAHVHFYGRVPKDDLFDSLASCRMVIFPSEWYESYPMVIVEAMAHGKPVIASDLGSMPSIIRDGENGMLFPAGHADRLAKSMDRLWTDDALRQKLSQGARDTFDSEMSEDSNYKTLMGIYDDAIAHRRRAEGTP